MIRRIVKRFLLRNNKESKDSVELGISEVKNDIQMIRHEMHKNLIHSKNINTKSLSNIHKGVLCVGTSIGSQFLGNLL